MRNITKSAEPSSLTAWRAEQPTNYLEYRDKDILRDHLIAEQRGLCCYCQCRIRAEWNAMKIEHWASHSGHENLRLVYSNLLAACNGHKGSRKRDQHCDTFKDDKILARNPANPEHNVEALLHYFSDGRITSSNTEFNDHLDSVLHLNLAWIKNNRKQALASLIALIQRRGDSMSRTRWEKVLAEFSGTADNSELPEYQGVGVYWIRKHLNRT